MNSSWHDTAPLLEIRDLRTSFVTDEGTFPVVDGVSIEIPRAKTVALVGESGCGKSVTALSILRLIPQPPGRIVGGRILFHRDAGSPPIDLLQWPDRKMPAIRGRHIAMIFQDPLVSLNPVYSVGKQIAEAIELHQPLRGRAAFSAAVEMLGKVGIAMPQSRAHDYPHQLSGGMRQRVLIAMALSCRPSLLIADEPTTALDVTVQAQILRLLSSLQSETQMSLLLITHDLGVVAQTADYVYVMYAGRIVEHAPVGDLFANPLHPYTKGLMRCMPSLAPSGHGRVSVATGEQRPQRATHRTRLETIRGTVPRPSHFPDGCRFHPRCDLACERAADPKRESIAIEVPAQGRIVTLRRCAEHTDDGSSGAPTLAELQPGHYVACWEADSM